MMQYPVKVGPDDFAPINVLLHRRLQTVGVLYWFFVYLLSVPFTLLFLPFVVFYTNYWWLLALYAMFYVYTYQTPRKGGWQSEFVQRMTIFKWFAAYFPVKLIKTAELQPNQNYLIGSHPHGIFCVGATTSFGTLAVGVHEKFPKLKIRIASTFYQFMFPVRREVVLSNGLIDCSRGSIEYVLSNEKKGNAVVLVVGGVEEALMAHRGMPTVLNLQKRKGFIKIALRTGAHLVPVFSFGENELYTQMENPEGSRLRSFQIFFKKMTGIPPFIIYGRGVFNNTFGFLPFRSPINVVVGKPIPVEKVEEPTEQQVDDLHTQYVDALKQLFEENKAQHGVAKDEKLIIN